MTLSPDPAGSKATAAALRIAVAGANGRMGRSVLAALKGRSDLTVSAALVRPDSPVVGQPATHETADPLFFTNDLDEALGNADGLIDFTDPETCVALAEAAAARGVFVVSGTTGLNDAQHAALDDAARRTVVVHAGNFSLGIAVLSALVTRAVEVLGPEFDIEIVEMHHRHKKDAPSGTALMLGEAAARGRGQSLEALRAAPRDGVDALREAGEIGFAALRGGGVIGEHHVLLASSAERLELVHRAEDRGLFAQGALRAALWAGAPGRPAGRYGLSDVLSLGSKGGTASGKG